MADENQESFFGPNPKRYERLSVPFADEDAANAALLEFGKEVAAARQKHKIPDLVVIARVTIADSESPSGEVAAQAMTHLGDSSKQLQMLAQEFGRAQQEHEDRIRRLVEGGRSMARPPTKRGRGADGG